MSESFSEKLDLVLKAFSISRGRLAADLGVDKSVVGRWVTGAVKPSAHNLSLLTAQVQRRVASFTTLDWDRSLADFASLLGADPSALPGFGAAPVSGGLPLPLLAQIRSATAMRGAAYEGFFRSTRPYLMYPGRFLHDHGMIRMDEEGLLRVRIGTAGTVVDGWMLPLQNQLFCVCVDITSGALLFGIFNGVATARAEVIDGLSLGSALDVGRTPTAYAMMFERIGDLSGDLEADEKHLAELAAGDPLAPEGSVSDALRDHLLRDVGPAQLAVGGDLLLRMPLARSLARGNLPQDR